MSNAMLLGGFWPHQMQHFRHILNPSALEGQPTCGPCVQLQTTLSHSMSLHVTANHMKIDRRKGSWLFYTIRMISRKCMTHVRKLALLFKMPILAVMNKQLPRSQRGRIAPLCLQGAGSLNNGAEMFP
jgi:hypothetical protein